MAWTYDSSIDPKDYWGMIYLIENTVTGQKYLGKKRFWTLKAKKIHKENNWKDYWGSCKELLEELEDDVYPESVYQRTILHFCVSDGEMSYLEAKELFLRDALVAKHANGYPEYLNGNILMCFHHRSVLGYQDKDRREKWLKTVATQKRKAGL